MIREQALKTLLVLLGMLFLAALIPLVVFFSREPVLAMMLSLYATLGVFLLIASRNPSGNHSLIVFTGWSSFAHAGVMTLQGFRNLIEPRELIGAAALAVIGISLLALARRKEAERREMAASA